MSLKNSPVPNSNSVYAYDEIGNQVRSGLDLNGDEELEYASSERISETETLYTVVDGEWWQQTVQRVYAEDGSPTATTVGTQRTQITGLGADGKVSETVSIDIHGNETTTTMTVDAESKTVTQTVKYPDTTIDAVSVSVNGLLESSTSKTGVTLTYDHDPLGRRTGVADPRTGTSITRYNDKGQVHYTEDAAGNRTTFTYDLVTGRKILETNALGKAARYAYNDRGQVTHTWADTPYPVKYVYDAYGRMSEMYTYRSGTDWAGTNWPRGETGDVTKWHYQESTGLLTAKEDAAGNSVTYTYGPGGRLATRTWARTVDGGPLVTAYTYDQNTGELLGIDYSDATPDIAFTYDRLGRQKTVHDAVGTRRFEYNDGLQLESETITGLYDRVITRTYETTGVIGRATGFSAGTDYSVTYGYEDTTGRFSSVAWNVAGNKDTATYIYVSDSDLLEEMTTESGTQTTYTYEPNRDLKTQVLNSYGERTISQYDYEHDELGRRTSVVNSGEAFSVAGLNQYSYNDRSELTESARYAGTEIDDPSNPVQNEYRSYDHDSIGNRTDVAVASDTGTYATNALNQYSLHDVAGGGTHVFTYDADGNLRSIAGQDGTINYSYNEENRLVSVGPAAPSDGDTKVDFAYDYRGRRIQKKVYTYAAGFWILTSDLRHVYDGWNLIAQTTDAGQETTDEYFIWGLDLSLSLQGAGGVGGLVSSVQDQASSTQYFCYGGNGNLGQLVAGADGSIAAQYEYDPYGYATDAEGDYAYANTFRFSTKIHDRETGLYYYGYRYYSAELGRWLSRDPIQEHGGLNVYQFGQNSPLNGRDSDGLLWEWSGLSEKIREASDTTYRWLSHNLSEYSELIVEEIAEQLHGAAREIKESDKRGRFSFEKRFKKAIVPKVLDVNWGYLGQKTSSYSDCYVSLEVGGRLGFTLQSPKRIPYIFARPVFLGGGNVKGGYRWYYAREPDVPQRKNLTGKFSVGLAGGLRWDAELTAFGYGAKAFAEIGLYGGWSYDFVTRRGDRGYGLYARAVLDVITRGGLGIERIDRYQARWTFGEGESIGAFD